MIKILLDILFMVVLYPVVHTMVSFIFQLTDQMEDE